MKKQFLIILMVASVLATVFVAKCTGGVTNTVSPSPVASTATRTPTVSPTPTPKTAPIPSANEFIGSHGLWSYMQSLWGRFWARSATKQPYKIIAGAVVVILALMVVILILMVLGSRRNF